jgi:hypothetical protein
MWKLQQGEAQEFISVDEARVIVPFRIVSVGRENVEVTQDHPHEVVPEQSGRS